MADLAHQLREPSLLGDDIVQAAMGVAYDFAYSGAMKGGGATAYSVSPFFLSIAATLSPVSSVTSAFVFG